MIIATLLGIGALAGAQAQNAFQSDKGGGDVAADSNGDDRDVARSVMTDDDVTLYTETNRDCVDDIEIILHWERAADLDLRVEGPDMCKISWRNPLSKWGGILVEDVIPEMCDGDHRYEEIVRYGNGVANGGIFAIDAHYYSDGGCGTKEVDFTITVTMGGKVVDTFKDTLRKRDDTSDVYYVLGFRSHPTRKHNCIKPKRPVPRPTRPEGEGEGEGRRRDREGEGEGRTRQDRRRSLLSVRRPKEPVREDPKCVCFHGKTVRRRGECEMERT